MSFVSWCAVRSEAFDAELEVILLRLQHRLLAHEATVSREHRLAACLVACHLGAGVLRDIREWRTEA